LDVHETIAARLLLACVFAAGACGAVVPSAQAVGSPEIASTWVTGVNATAADLHTEINPNGSPTKYLFEYISDAGFQANLAAGREEFFGAGKVPPSPTGIGSGTSFTEWTNKIEFLAPSTVYHYRAVASNGAGTTVGTPHTLTTELPTNVIPPLDNRGWEMVSPIDKNGGSIQGPGESFGGGVFQAAAAGGALTYSSIASFGSDPQGAPVASQYLAHRNGDGWSAENITTPLLSGSYGDRPDGVPYQLFSTDLSRGLLLNGQRCRGSEGECPVANPPLPGSGAPPGYMNYYLRDNGSGDFGALLRAPDIAGLAVGPAQFELSLAGATSDLAHVVLSSCAALTADATEIAAPGGCDPAAQNLYEWGSGGLELLNLLPGETAGEPGAELGAQSGAISSDGSRVYWTENGNLYLREGAQTKQVDEAQGGGGAFETAAANGSVAFFSKEGHLFRYVAATNTATDLTAPGAEVLGVLGASADGSRVYYGSAAGVELRREGTTTELAAGATAAAAANYPPATGTARVTPDGSHLAFLSSAELTGYENFGFQEVFLYGPPPGGGAATLTCASCNPTGERPNGAASIPGAVANGTGSTATRVYKPRALTDDGSRVFFDSSDVLAGQDSNLRPDVYEWEASGIGGCARADGCVGLVSSGRSREPSLFIDASADGTDVFFLTEYSLVPQDPGSYDLYDFRENGGFPVPPTPIPCEADACQSLPAAPEDPTPGTLVPNSGNPALRFSKRHHKHRKRRHKKKNAGKKHRHEKGHGKKGGRR
jgi:hypothetical protein